MPSPGGHDERFVLSGIFAALVCLTAVAGFFLRDAGDFRMFYDAGTAARSGRALYTAETPNLNPPSVVYAIFAPLSNLSYRGAQLLWTLAGVVSLTASLRRITTTLELSVKDRHWVIIGLLSSYPAWLAWFQGQIVWLLMYPMTRAWLAYRRGEYAVAGLWLSPVIAIKPQAALLALLLNWRLWLVAGGTSAVVTAAGVGWTGFEPWLAWWRIGSRIRWLAWPDNASLWGLASRISTGRVLGGALSDLPLAAIAAVIVFGVLAAWRVVRQRDPDRRLALAGLCTLLLTPLGWVYYLVLLTGPLVAMRRVFPRSAAWFLWIPLPLLLSLVMSTRIAAITVGSLYTVAILSASTALAMPRSRLD